MVSTFQLTRSTELYLTHRITRKNATERSQRRLLVVRKFEFKRVNIYICIFQLNNHRLEGGGFGSRLKARLFR